MPIGLTWQDVAVRLALALAAGALIGVNRGGHGRPAGLRTNILVCLAAAIAMILANLLLSSPGGESDPSLRMDVMRLPLGILSGMGFIGAGAILRRGDAVRGVTTAATLWFITVVGLCLGSGQLGLGVAGLALGMFVLWGLKLVEDRLRQEQRATLVVRCAAPRELKDEDIRARLSAAGLWVASAARTYGGPSGISFTYDVRWHARISDPTPAVIEELAATSAVTELQWRPRG